MSFLYVLSESSGEPLIRSYSAKTNILAKVPQPHILHRRECEAPPYKEPQKMLIWGCYKGRWGFQPWLFVRAASKDYSPMNLGSSSSHICKKGGAPTKDYSPENLGCSSSHICKIGRASTGAVNLGRPYFSKKVGLQPRITALRTLVAPVAIFVK